MAGRSDFDTAASIAVLATGVSLFLDVRGPEALRSAGRGSGLASLVDLLPLGEFVVIGLAVFVSFVIVQTAREGRMRIDPTYPRPG